MGFLISRIKAPSIISATDAALLETQDSGPVGDPGVRVYKP